MPYEELLEWFAYFKRRPVGWREDQRTYMLLQAQGVKEKPDRIFSSLAAIKETPQPSIAESLFSSGFLNKLQNTAVKNNVNWEITIDKT